MVEIPEGQAEWERLVDQFVAAEAGVERGKMMSADALTVAGKVFAFYSSKGGRAGLGCRLGRTFDISTLDLTDWQHLAPFKTKPPMKDWIVVGLGDLSQWTIVADTALKLAKQNQGAF